MQSAQILSTRRRGGVGANDNKDPDNFNEEAFTGHQNYDLPADFYQTATNKNSEAYS